MELREYQKQIIKDTLQALKDNRQVLIVAATGAGKSLILSKTAELCIKANKRVIIVAHRLKLLKQVNETFKRVSGEAGSMIAPGFKSDYSNPLQLAMIQTLGSKSRKLPDNIDIVLVDECHLTTSFAGFERLMNHCNGSIWALGKTKLVGLTGTPYRNNKKEGLCRWFNHIIQAPTGRQLMNDGYLTPPEIYTYASGAIDLDSIKIDSATGDFSVKDAIAACTPDYLTDVFEKWYSVNPKAKTIVFCAGVQQTEIMLGLFQSKGISACSLTGETTDKQRDDIFKKFETGEYQVLLNAQVLCEGFDSPSIQSVLLARPTRSLALGIQMIGRGTRLFEGKKTFDFIDCGGFIEHFISKGIYDVFAIDKFNIHPKYKIPGELPTKQCPSCEQYVNVFALICPHCETPFPPKVKEQSMIFFPDLIKLDAENLKSMKAEYRFARKEMEKIFLALGDIRDLEKKFFTKFKKLPNKEFLRGALFNGNDDDLTRSVFSHYLAGCVGTNSELIKHYFRLEFGDDRLVKPFSPAGYLGVVTPPKETTSEMVNRLYSEKLETHNPTILNYSYLSVIKRIS